jgi:Tol biopolymer transport system component
MNADGSDPLRLADLPDTDEYGVDLSPDETRLLIAACRDTDLDSFSIDLQTSAVDNLTMDDAYERSPETSACLGKD